MRTRSHGEYFRMFHGSMKNDKKLRFKKIRRLLQQERSAYFFELLSVLLYFGVMTLLFLELFKFNTVDCESALSKVQPQRGEAGEEEYLAAFH